MRRAAIPAAVAGLALAALTAGCSKSEPDQAPAACLEGPDAYIEALRGAPAEVRLREETPISDCLPPDQEGGELAQVGGAMIVAATRLNKEARGAAGGDAPVQLGYLVGASESAAEESAGIHADLLLRLTSAARFSPSGESSEQFERGYERGREAGREGG